MSIKCSLLGHDFGDTDVEEERVEQGSEVVTTIKEIETCARCGKSRVVSENKEVTAIETAGDESADQPADDVGGTTDPSPAPDMDAVEDDAELIGEAEPEPVDVDAEPEEAEAPADDTDEFDADPEESDTGAEILDDSEDDRSPGEWPDEEEEDAPEGSPAAAETADVGGDEESTNETTGDTGEDWPNVYGTDESSDDGTDVDWPDEDEPEDDYEGAATLTQLDDREIEPAGSATVTVPEGEFYCPECEFTTPVEESSLREGDFCPECHRGSLAHRSEAETRKE